MAATLPADRSRASASLFGTSDFATTRDGRRLHYVSASAGAPVVIFESGMGSSHRIWGLVQPAIAAHTRTVVYDRSGWGASPGDPAPRTLARVAADLQDLLHHLGEGPFVLVAHSWGGPIVRRIAELEPHLVCGLVLVDASDEGCALYFTKAAVRQQRLFARLLPLAARTGLLRRATRRIVRPLPLDLANELLREDSGLEAAWTFASELEPFADDMRELREAPAESLDIPVSVISGTLRPRFGVVVRTALVDAHERRAAALPRGRHVRAERSGHYVLLTEPELVIDEILRVVHAASEPSLR